MDANEAICMAFEAAAIDESPEAMAFNDALASTSAFSGTLNEDGSIDLVSGDAKLSIPADAISGAGASDSIPPPPPEGM